MAIALSIPQNWLSGYAAITASTTQTQAGGTAVTAQYNSVTTGNANDAITLPAAAAGQIVFIKNASAATLGMFPPVGGAVNAGTVNAVSALTASKNVLVVYTSAVDVATFQLA